MRAGQGRRLEKMWRSWLSLFGFRCVFILLAVAEGDDNLIGACRVSRVRKIELLLFPSFPKEQITITVINFKI